MRRRRYRGEASAPAISRDTTPGGSTNVLVADNNADMREYLRGSLAPRYDVRTVGYGAGSLGDA